MLLCFLDRIVLFFISFHRFVLFELVSLLLFHALSWDYGLPRIERVPAKKID